jgi:hypothetical protein
MADEQRGTAQKFIGANGRPYWKARAKLLACEDVPLE